MFARIKTKIKHKLGIWDYKRDQRYNCEMNIVISNHTDKTKNLTIVCPLPIKQYHQNKITKLIINSSGSILNENKFHNQYISWKTDLKPNESKKFNYLFDIETKPIKVFINPELKLNDYRLSSTDKKWLEPNKFINSKNEQIKSISQEVLKNETNILNCILKINSFILAKLNYANPIKGLYSDQDALKMNDVDCGGYSTLFVSICQTIGVPARIICGFWIDRPGKEMHAWAEFMLPDKTWVPVDLSIQWLRDKRRESKFASLGLLGSDRVAVSYGCDLEIPNQSTNKLSKIDILQTPFILNQENIDIKYTLTSARLK
jgi:hypothetical protein